MSVDDVLTDPARLRALQRSGLLACGAEEVFDRLTRLASRLLGTPVATMTLIDGERQYFKSAVGTGGADPIALEDSLCRHVVLDTAPVVVPDARVDPRFAGGRAIEVGIIAYCGVPLTDADGHTLGSMCAIDHVAREWSEDDVEMLRELAEAAMSEVALRAANRELERRGSQLRSIIDSTHEALITCLADGTITEFNPAAVRLLGHAREQAIGADVVELLIPEERRERARTHLRDGEITPGRRAETVLCHRDGRELTVEVSLSLVDSPGGRTLRVLAWDIGELRELRLHREHLATIVEAADEAIGAVDLEGRITSWNRGAERLLGHTAQEMVGRMLPAMDDTGDSAAAVARALAGESATLHAAPRRRRDGRLVYVDLSLAPIRDSDGVIRGATAVARDVTEQMRLERTLVESEIRFRRTFDDAPIGIVLAGPDRRLMSVNHAFCEMLGYEESELVGRTLEGITHPDDLNTDIEGVRSIVERRSMRYETIKRYRHRSGRLVRVRLTASLVRTSDGDPSHLIAHVEDITAAHAARTAAREAQELLDESQSVAHVGSWSFTPATGEVMWSAEEFRLYGLEPREQAPSLEELCTLVHRDDREPFRQTLGSLLQSPRAFSGEYRVIAGGRTRVLATSAEVLPADPSTGRPERVSGTTRDVTAERAAATARREVEQRHGRLLASMPDTAVVLYDRELRCVLVQGGLTETLGMSPEQFEGRPIAELLTPEQSATLIPLISRALAGETSSIETEDGAGHAFQVEFAPYHDERGRITGAFAVWRDVTARVAREHENRMLATMLQQSEDAIIAKSADGTIVEWNRGAERLYGHTREQAVGRSIAMIVPPERDGEDRRLLSGALAGEGAQLETTRMRKDGSRVEVSISVSPLYDDAGRVTGASVIARDITDRIREQRARHEVEERLRVTVEHAPIGMALVDLHDGRRGRLVGANEAFTQLLTDPDPVAAGVTITALVHPEDSDALRADLTLLSTDNTARTETEVRCLHPDGTIVWLQVTGAAVPAAEGSPTLAVLHALDIGERKRFEGRLQHLADHDALTGLFNRRRFGSELERAVTVVKRYHQPGALLMIDLDGFKHVNDTMGHSCGDELIARIATTLRAALRETDVIGRLGGDEFAVILGTVGGEEAALVGEKLLRAIQEHGIVLGEHRHAAVTASIGIALFDGSNVLDGEELLAEADLAMYTAKNAGRNQLVVSAPGPDGERHSARRSSLSRLRSAIAEQRLELHAQPIQGICASGIERFELLLRLRTPDGELLAPASFLENAERFDLIQEIDRWVFAQALRHLHDHDAAGHDISLSVNMSGKTLNDPELIADLTAMVADCPIPRDRLVVEVTETAAIVNIERARDVACALRELGCRFALDDFGSGFASFYYLKHLEFDYVKIDGEFVKALAANPTDQLVVGSVVGIARGLGAQTIAEFVGDDEAVRHLRDLGVDYGQGYHLGRPGPLAEVLPLGAGEPAG